MKTNLQGGSSRPADPPGLRRAEIRFCRAIAAHGDPLRAFAHGWPGFARTFKEATVVKRVGELMELPNIQSAIEHYQMDMNSEARERLDWNKAKIASDRLGIEQRLGLGLVDIPTVNDRGTPETRRKLRSDVVSKLRASDTITEPQVWAAREIHSVIEARQRGLFASGRALDGTKIDGSYGARELPDAMTGYELEAYRKHYRPWLTQIGARYISEKKRRITVAQLVYEVVLNNRGPRQIEDEYKLRHGSAAEILRDALNRYAAIAGWLTASS